MQEKWVVAAKRADFYGIAEKFHIDPVTARLIRNRDVIGDDAIEKYLYGGLKDLYPPEQMKGIPEASAFLLEKIKKGAVIRIIGDYDIDGVMSSYILLKGLGRLGAHADVRIPDRIRDGYGLNANLVRDAEEDGIDVIVTCDNGIAAAGEVALAGQLGMQVVVTDHHEVPYTDQADGSRHYMIPQCEAVVDPKQPGCTYPFDGLCGAGVAFKLICRMFDEAGIAPSEKEAFLEYVAFATIGDVMDLVDENRILVREGLKRLRKTENIGLQELIRQSGIEPDHIDVYHIGFVLGPCLNASGRLDTAARALELLTSETREEAARLAGDLIALNAGRKAMTQNGEEEAEEIVEAGPLCNDRVLVVYLPDCHESIAGIVAGRLREHFNKPAFVLTKAHDGGVKGSGRSIETYDMYGELCKCRSCFTKFGGHRMAAGISMESEAMIDVFRRQINENCTLRDEDMIPKIVIDVAMPVHYLSHSLLTDMEILKPFGKGNPKPVFAESGMRVLFPKVFGKNRNVVKMQLEEKKGFRIDAVYFGDGDAFLQYISGHRTISVIYYPSVDHFRGRNTLQVTITNYR